MNGGTPNKERIELKMTFPGTRRGLYEFPCEEDRVRPRLGPTQRRS
jgi:hypothetical protein